MNFLAPQSQLAADNGHQQPRVLHLKRRAAMEPHLSLSDRRLGRPGYPRPNLRCIARRVLPEDALVQPT